MLCLDLNQDAKLLYLYMVLTFGKLCCVMFRFGSTGDCIPYAAKLDHKGLYKRKKRHCRNVTESEQSFSSIDTVVKMLHLHDL